MFLWTEASLKWVQDHTWETRCFFPGTPMGQCTTLMPWASSPYKWTGFSSFRLRQVNPWQVQQDHWRLSRFRVAGSESASELDSQGRADGGGIERSSVLRWSFTCWAWIWIVSSSSGPNNLPRFHSRSGIHVHYYFRIPLQPTLDLHTPLLCDFQRHGVQERHRPVGGNTRKWQHEILRDHHWKSWQQPIVNLRQWRPRRKPGLWPTWSAELWPIQAVLDFLGVVQ